MVAYSLVWAAMAGLWTRSLLVDAIALDIDDPNSIKQVAGTIAYDMMKIYKGNESGQVPGLLPPPSDPKGGYYWWECGAMFGSLIDYWYYTGDDSYNDNVMQGMLFQVGAHQDYQPINETASLGNDDQAFWGMAALTAAELKFPDPPTGSPQWLALAQAVFNTQANPNRYDGTCGGGLRWQIPQFNTGYDYKNSISNGCFFNMGARLAVYTGNASYADYAEKAWDWVTSVGFIDAEYNIYDGAHVEHNCTDINPVQFSYNHGVFLLGAATMYNFTNGSTIWRTRTEGLLNHTISYFFSRNNTAYEVPCEGRLNCTPDMFSFKAYLTRWMAAATKVAPFITERVLVVLRASAINAALQCSGGDNGRMCGLSWVNGSDWDGTQGVGQQMAAMEVIQSNLIKSVDSPVTSTTGGTSIGNPSAGSDSTTPGQMEAPTKADRVGGGFVTAILLIGCIALFVFMTAPDDGMPTPVGAAGGRKRRVWKGKEGVAEKVAGKLGLGILGSKETEKREKENEKGVTTMMSGGSGEVVNEKVGGIESPAEVVEQTHQNESAPAEREDEVVSPIESEVAHTPAAAEQPSSDPDEIREAPKVEPEPDVVTAKKARRVTISEESLPRRDS